MSSTHKASWLILSPVVLAFALTSFSAVAAGAEVSFVKPDSFTDVPRDETGREQVLAELKAHLQRAAATWLPAEQTLQIEVTQVNLAGEMEPIFRRGMQDVRVMRTVSWPSMELHYKLSNAAGQTLKEADARLAELDYLQRGTLRYGGEALAHEKAMIDRWFQSEFRVERQATGK